MNNMMQPVSVPGQREESKMTLGSLWKMSTCGHHAVQLDRAWRPLRGVVGHVLMFINVQVTCSLFLILIFALTPTLGASSDTTLTPKPGSDGLGKGATNSNGSSNSYSEYKSHANSSSLSNVLIGGQKLFNSHSPSVKQQDENPKSSGTNHTTSNLSNLSGRPGDKKREKKRKKTQRPEKEGGSPSAQKPVPGRREIEREFPVALVTAASVAAFCILLFFLLAYIWHTRQLDSRARKLAIRLAADAEEGRRAMGQCVSSCRNCGSSSGGRITSSSSSGRYTLAPPLVRPDSLSSSQDKGQYEPLTCTSTSFGGGLGIDTEGDRGLGPDSISGRSSVGVSESEAGDSEDVFEPACSLPVIPPDRLRALRSGGRGAHRKWSRSKKGVSGSASFEKRDSAVTDKEILTHFASRRHSTFFI